MKKGLNIIIISVLFAAPSFSEQRELRRPGDYQQSIVVDNRERTYILHIPAAFDPNKSYPLIMGFHGGGGSGQKFSRQTKFNVYADREGFIAVYPDGIEHNWNDGRGTTDAEKLGVDDVKLVRTLTEHLKGELPIDAKRVYATGVSNGGIFSQRLACEMSDIFSAIGSDVGPIAANIAPKCNPSKPISVVAIQGTADPLIPINGGAVEGGDGGLVESAENTMNLWASKNTCSAARRERLPISVDDGTAVDKTAYSDCGDNTEVVYHIVNGMGHTWPPKEGKVKLISGPTSGNIDATKVFWEFFKEHPKKSEPS